MMSLFVLLVNNNITYYTGDRVMDLKKQILKDLSEMDGREVNDKYNDIYEQYKIAVADLQRDGFIVGATVFYYENTQEPEVVSLKAAELTQKGRELLGI